VKVCALTCASYLFREGRLQAKRKKLTRFYRAFTESHGQNLALTVVCVPYSLDSSLARLGGEIEAEDLVSSVARDSFLINNDSNFGHFWRIVEVSEFEVLAKCQKWPDFEPLFMISYGWVANSCEARSTQVGNST